MHRFFTRAVWRQFQKRDVGKEGRLLLYSSDIKERSSGGKALLQRFLPKRENAGEERYRSTSIPGERASCLGRLRRLPADVGCASSQAEIALRKAIWRASSRFVGGLFSGQSRRATLSPAGVSRHLPGRGHSRSPRLMSRAIESPAAARRLARMRGSSYFIIRGCNRKEPTSGSRQAKSSGVR
jgi:hypothetical protein